MSDLIAYIPARGGSKRLPGKNVRPLGGVPVIVRVIRALKACSFIHAVCVSTDDAKTAQIAQDAGAVTLDSRAPKLSDDHASFSDLLREDVPRFLSHEQISPEHAELCFVLPTAALLSAHILTAGYHRFRETGAPLLVATLPMPVSPFRALVPRPDGRSTTLFPTEIRQRTQDMLPASYDTGMFYFMKYRRLAEFEGHWFSIPEGIECFPLPPEIAIDVDTQEDWERLDKAFSKASEVK